MSLFNRISNPRGPAVNPNSNNNPGNKQVCQFYLEGRCRFGADCRNYHPPRDGSSNPPSQARNPQQQLPYYLSADTVRADLTTGEERPAWPLSAYGPGRDAPRQLLEGILEQSPEELRTQAYLAKLQGVDGAAQYERNESQALEQANGRVQSVLSDLDGALKYVIDGKDVHPNREDQVQKPPGNFQWSEKPSLFNPNAPSATQGRTTFGQSTSLGGPGSTAGQTSTFGQPSTFGAASAFGGSRPQTSASSAFGQPSALGGGGGGQASTAFGGAQTTSTFGAPSTLGSAFGKPSTIGGGVGSSFGQASTLGGSSPFGTSMGANAPGNQGSAFGQTSALGGGGGGGGGPAFGKPSPFGATTAAPAFGSTTPFGASSSQQASGSSPFSQAAAGQGQSTFGQPSGAGSAFGQPSAPNSQPSAFASRSPFASAAGGVSGASTFGQPSQPNSQPTFGSASPFGASSAPTTAASNPAPAFGSGGTSTASPFGSSSNSAPPNNANPISTPSAFGQPSNPNPRITATNSTAPAARPPGHPPTSFKNQPIFTEDRISYYANPATGGKKERIWFPEGPPGPNPDVEAETPTVYDDGVLGEALRQVYEYVREHGVFKDGLVPEVPPRREWVSWEL